MDCCVGVHCTVCALCSFTRVFVYCLSSEGWFSCLVATLCAVHVCRGLLMLSGGGTGRAFFKCVGALILLSNSISLVLVLFSFSIVFRVSCLCGYHFYLGILSMWVSCVSFCLVVLALAWCYLYILLVFVTLYAFRLFLPDLGGRWCLSMGTGMFCVCVVVPFLAHAERENTLPPLWLRFKVPAAYKTCR